MSTPIEFYGISIQIDNWFISLKIYYEITKIYKGKDHQDSTLTF